MTLRYPLGIGTSFTRPAYVSFTPVKYRANSSNIADIGLNVGEGQTGPAGPGALPVVLYMPNSTPMMGNANDWGEIDFKGPIGEQMKKFGAATATTIDKQPNLNPVELVKNAVEQFTNSVSGGQGGGNALKQAALENIPKDFGATGEQFLAMARGKVYNPNVELIYQQPKLRVFTFEFRFVPKDAIEATQVNRIIKNFKKWSAPRVIEGTGFMEVPYVWNIAYKLGGEDNPNLNKFKRAACTSVQVRANPSSNLFVSHQGGVPIEQLMQLSFKEVDYITRADHDEGNQGY